MKMFQFIKKAAVMMVIVMGCVFTAEAQCIHKAGIQERIDSCMRNPSLPTMQMEAVRLTGELYEPCLIYDGGSSTGTIYPPSPKPNGLDLPISPDTNKGFTPGGNGLYNNNGSMTNHISSYSGKSFISQWFDVALIVTAFSAYFLFMLILFVRDKNKKAGKPTDFASVFADSIKAITDFFLNIGRKIKSKYSSETPSAEQQDKKEEGEK